MQLKHIFESVVEQVKHEESKQGKHDVPDTQYELEHALTHDPFYKYILLTESHVRQTVGESGSHVLHVGFEH